jgi:hypothetical protein
MGSQQIDNYSYWTFIEKTSPKYYSCGDILLVIYSIENNWRTSHDEDEIKDWNVEAELSELNQIIFSCNTQYSVSLVKNIPTTY